MSTVAFSGPTDLTRLQEEYVRREVGWIAANHENSCYVSGAAFGVDTVAILAAWEYAPKPVEIVLTVPKGKWHNRGLVNFGLTEGWKIEHIDGGYMARNDRTVELATDLAAFPSTPVPQRRSGTWATVRRAERKGIPVYYFPLTYA